MGPVMNLALAVVLMAVVLYQGAQLPAFDREPVVIGSLTPQSVAVAAGLKPGNRILAVDGQPLANWEDFSVAVLPNAKKALTLDVERDGQRSRSSVTPRAAGKYRLGRARRPAAGDTRRSSRPTRANRRSRPASGPTT